MKTKHISIGLALVCLLFGVATLTARVGAAETDPRYIINQNDISPRIVLFTSKENIPSRLVTPGSTIPMKWAGINLSGSAIDISLVGLNGTSSILIASSTPNDGQETVTFPANLAPGEYRMQFRAGTSTVSTTWAIYRVAAPTVYAFALTSPTASTTVVAGRRVSVTWTSSNIPAQTRVYVTLVNSTNENTPVHIYGTSTPTKASGVTSFLIPSTVVAGQYKINAVAALAGGVTVTASSSYFTVLASSTATTTATTTSTSTATTTVPAPTFTFSNITASTTATAGRNLTVSWTSTNVLNGQYTVVKLVNASSTDVATVYAGELPSQGTGSITIPSNTPAGQYRLKWMATVRGVARTATSSVFRVVR